jgi:DNA-binding transcriptional MerR regulator
MLRYYEQVGLIQSQHIDGYAYRMYDENAVRRLRQIIVLRKLRIPVKQIVSILSNSGAAEAVEIFRQNISRLDEEITALSTVKSILTRFIEEINEKADIRLRLLGDETVFSVISSLSFSNNQIKEDLSMGDLNNASETLSKLEDKDIRIVFLPPMTVAAYRSEGEGCEGRALDAANKLVLENNLIEIKPDLRQFGFDCSKGAAAVGESSHAYEVWVSVPDDMEIPEPLVKRKFNGGMYAAHVLRAWDFQDWNHLKEWVAASEKYDNAWGEPRFTPDEMGMGGQGFEESLNYWNNAQNGFRMEDLQLDLLLPIKIKEAKFPYELSGPYTDADWTYWKCLPHNVCNNARKMIVEHEGSLGGGFAGAVLGLPEWTQFDGNHDRVTVEDGRIIFDIKELGGSGYAFASWEPGSAVKIKRVYLEKT